MEQVNIHEAKTHLSRLLARVAAGEVITGISNPNLGRTYASGVEVVEDTTMDTQLVSVTITGTNDQPEITGDDSAALTETDTTISDTGTLNVIDVDLSDLVDVAVDSLSVNPSGTFGPSHSCIRNAEVGQKRWI